MNDIVEVGDGAEWMNTPKVLDSIKASSMASKNATGDLLLEAVDSDIELDFPQLVAICTTVIASNTITITSSLQRHLNLAGVEKARLHDCIIASLSDALRESCGH